MGAWVRKLHARGAPTPDAPDLYSPAKNGRASPRRFESTGRPTWAPLPIPTGQAYDEAEIYGETIRAELAGDNSVLVQI
jgi:hypothetical protein